MKRCQPANGNAKLSTKGLSLGLSFAVDNQIFLCFAFPFTKGETFVYSLIRKLSTRRVLLYGTKALTAFVSVV
jgi:hypothetical protein